MKNMLFFAWSSGNGLCPSLYLYREAQEVFVEERDSDAAGDEWERVSRLCDFNPKNNKNTKDVSRMRSIFLQLKQTPLVR